MPRIGQDRNSIFQTPFQLSDDRGNPLSVLGNDNPLSRLTKPKGIHRTFVPQITKDTKVDMSGKDGMSILVSIPSPAEIGAAFLSPFRNQGAPTNPPGFTPPSAYFIQGDKLLNKETGMPVEVGVMLINSTSAQNKIARTDLAQNGNSVVLKFTPGTVGGNQNIYGNKNAANDPSFGGWVNPVHYVTKPDEINDKTGLPKELGDYPYNYNESWGAAYYTRKVDGVVKTTPSQKVKGSRFDDIPSKHEAFEDYRLTKSFETVGFGGFEQYDFVHNLDRKFHDDDAKSLSSLEKPTDVYLASFVDLIKNLKEFGNEDPVMFGFDIIIDWETSPLFNGAIPEFCAMVSGRKTVSADTNTVTSPTIVPTISIGDTITHPELLARVDLWDAFVDQFKKFFKVNRSFGQNEDRKIVKSYYLKKISGLDFLVEGAVSNTIDNVKSMVDYGKDMIKLTLYEDVTVNMGYLGSLYKAMSWSRLNGKQMIPENLLRFDCKIVVSEIRNYKRLVQMTSNPAEPEAGQRWEEYADNVNKYVYSLYDCQFQFDKVSHGDSLDLTATNNYTSEYEIAFTFKYSNLKFERFDPKTYEMRTTPEVKVETVDNSEETPINIYKRRRTAEGGTSVFRTGRTGRVSSPDLSVDNLVPYNLDPTDVYPDEISRGASSAERDTNGKLVRAGRFSGLSEGTGYRPDAPSLGKLKEIDKYRKNDNKWTKYKGSLETSMDKAKRQERNKKLVQELGRKLKGAAVREVNRRVADQARLLNRTLDRIRDAVGLGRMSAPRNVYEGDLLQNDIRNAFRQFIGQSVRGFFTP